MKLPRLGWSLVAFVVSAVTAFATIDPSLQMQLGNPSGATADPANHAHYLINRAQYALDYNDTTEEPNWVSWDLTAADIGSSGRSPNFIPDTNLPASFHVVQPTDYSGSGYDRGHMCPSADRTTTADDNLQLFYMSNILPQTPDNNQGVWENLESYCRDLANAGNEVLITSGPSLFGGSHLAGGPAIPGYTWKIVVVVPAGAGTALSRVSAATRVIAVKIPNIAGVRSDPWQKYVTSVHQIETDTGYVFFDQVPASVSAVLKSEVDGQTLVGAPAITAQPVAQSSPVGGAVSFTVAATGDSPFTYQWQKDDEPIAGATGATYTVASVKAADAGTYDVTVSNDVGAITSAGAALVVTGLPPAITTGPGAATVSAGSTATLAVSASGSPTLSYQWYLNGAPVGGATGATLSLADAQSANAGTYHVTITNGVGSVTSGDVLLTVNPAAPAITAQPGNSAISIGGAASFTVGAAGSEPLAYQWYKDGSPLSDTAGIAGSHAATLAITNATTANNGSYQVQITNTYGTATSIPATLAVSAAPVTTNVTWAFTAGTGAPDAGALPATLAGGDFTIGNAFGTVGTPISTTSPSSGSGAYAGNSGTFNIGNAAAIGSLITGAGGSAYFEVTLTPTGNQQVVASALAFGSRSTGTGPTTWALYSSVDNFATPAAGGTFASVGTTNWGYNTAALALTGAAGSPVTYRIYGYNGAGNASKSTINWRLDDVKLTVSTPTPAPVAPAVVSTVPANGTIGAASNASITVKFNQNVTLGSSWFTIQSAAAGNISATVTGSGSTYTIDPPVDFLDNDTITVTLHAAQISDATGTLHPAADTAFTFTTAAPVAPVITANPNPATVTAGGSASFTVAASGTAPFSYQWRKGGVAVTGNASASSATLTLAAAALGDEGNYDCVVTNSAGSATSTPAALTVLPAAPSITLSPTPQTVGLGGIASFTVSVGGTAPFTYQWRKDGSALADGGAVSGAGTATLTLAGVDATSMGNYDVIVSNGGGSATSQPAALTVTSTPAVNVVDWTFTPTDGSPTSGLTVNVTGGLVVQGNNFFSASNPANPPLISSTSASSGYTGVTGGNNAGIAARIGAFNPGSLGSAYFETTLTAAAGRQVVATALAFGSRSTSTGPQAYAVYSSADGFAAPLFAGTFSNDSTWRHFAGAFGPIGGALGGPLTFRIYGFGGAGNAGAGTANWRIDDLQISITAVAPIAPAISASPQSATAVSGGAAGFSMSATGSVPLTYQWRQNGVPITGNPSALTPNLSLPIVKSAAAGGYDCVVTNAAGSAVTSLAGLTVTPAPAQVTLGSLNGTYTGGVQTTTASTTPPGLTVLFTYDGVAAAIMPLDGTLLGYAGAVGQTLYVNATGVATGTVDGAGTGPFGLDSVVGAAAVQAGVLTVGQTAVLQVTILPGGLFQIVGIATSGFTQGPVNAGVSQVVATIADTDYAGSASGQLTIGKAAPALTWSAPAAITYGTPLGAAQLDATAAVPGTFTYSPAAGTVLGAGANQPLAATFTPTDAGNYSAGAIGTTVSVAAAPVTITITGTSATYDGSGKAVTISTQPANVAVAVTYGDGADLPVHAGQYGVIATSADPNYAGAASAQLTIAPAAPALVWAPPAPITYGTALGGAQLNASANVAGTFVYSPSLGTVLDAGAGQTLTATFTPTDTIDYTSAVRTTTLTVNPAAAPIVLSGLTQAYDGNPHPVTATTTPGGLTVSLTYDGGATPPTLPGPHAVVATIQGGNYAGSSAADTLVITVTALVRHAPTLNGLLEGSLEQLTAENVTLNGGAAVSGDILVPGTPAIRLNGKPALAGTKDAAGSAAPSNYTVTLNGNAVARYIVRRVDAIALPVVAAPPAPHGTRDVAINSAGQSAGDFSTVRNLTLNGNVGAVAVPAGTYGNLTVNGGSTLVLGVAGATTPAAYNVQNLTINGGGALQIAGPVVLTGANGITFNGNAGTAAHPSWLAIDVANGGVTLNGNVTVAAAVVAPNGTVVINGNSTLTGGVSADRLTLNGNGGLQDSAQ